MHKLGLGPSITALRAFKGLLMPSNAFKSSSIVPLALSFLEKLPIIPEMTKHGLQHKSSVNRVGEREITSYIRQKRVLMR